MKFCPECGSKNPDGNKFCIHCGTKLSERSALYDNTGGMGRGMYDRDPAFSDPSEEIIYTSAQHRSIAACIVFSILTLGIYMIYWMYKLNNDVNEMAQEPSATGGAMVVILSLLTLGIYQLYWLYKMGQRCDVIQQRRSSNNVIFLILGLFGFAIVAYALIQDTINKALE